MVKDIDILQLRSEIRFHNRLYYDLDNPSISDGEYDLLVSRLSAISPNDPILNEMGNPTYHTKVQHSILMGSLNKIHSIDEIITKFMGHEICLMPKVDGLSVAIRYNNSHYDWAATRGNGVSGELITPNVARMKNLPLIIPESNLEVRGEAYISKSDFYGVMDCPGYDGREDGYANPRNAAAGAIRQKDPKETFNRNVQYVAYKAFGLNCDTQSQLLNQLSDQGFHVVDYWLHMVTSNSASWLESQLAHIKNYDFGYNIDGVVIMFNNLNEFESAGTGSKCPKGAIAFKYKTESVTSTALDIIWETSRSGRVVPVLVIDKCEIDGTVVSRISLHNYKWMMDRDVAIGDTISFTKANDIIPYLTGVVHRVDTRNTNIPDRCPSCAGILKFSYNDQNDKMDLICLNNDCPAKFIKHIRRILQLFDVKGIDEKTLTKMESVGLLNNVWDIFDIDFESLVANGFGEGESSNWVNALTNITTTPQSLLATMGIVGWGNRMFEILFKDKMISSENWVYYVVNYGCDNAGVDIEFSRLVNIDQIGEERSKSLQLGIMNHWEIVKEISERVTIEYPEEIIGGILEGKTFCATGSLTRKRKDIYAEIISLGGEIKSGVSKGLDYLITGDATGSKLVKAQKLDISIINEDQLNNLMGK